jgi:hypothetical protein
LISQQRDTAYQFLNILKAEKFQIFSPNSKLTDAQLVQLNDVSVLQKTKWLWINHRYGMPFLNPKGNRSKNDEEHVNIVKKKFILF